MYKLQLQGSDNSRSESKLRPHCSSLFKQMNKDQTRQPWMNGNKELDIAFTGVSRSISPKDYYKQMKKPPSRPRFIYRNLPPEQLTRLHREFLDQFCVPSSSASHSSRFCWTQGTPAHPPACCMSKGAWSPSSYQLQTANCSETHVTQVVQKEWH